MNPIPKNLWRGFLERFEEDTTASRFQEEFPGLEEKFGPDRQDMVGAYFAILGELFLVNAGLFAVLELPTAEIRAALEEIARTVRDIDYQRGVKELSPEDRDHYQQFVELASARYPDFAEAMREVLGRYISGAFEPHPDPNALIEQALLIAEEDLPRAREMITEAGARALTGQPYWHRWGTEAHGPAGPWLDDVILLVEALGRADFYGPWEERQSEFQAILREAAAAKAEAETIEEEEPFEEDLGQEIAERLIALGEQSLPEDLIATCKEHRDEVIPALIELAADEDLALEEAPGAGYGPIHAVDLLGDLQAVESIPVLIDLVADTDPSAIIFSTAIHALEAIGTPALEPILQFMRYSRSNDAKANFSYTLVEVGRGDERAFQVLVSLLPQITWDEGKGLILSALGETEDPRIIPLLQEALQDPDLPYWNQQEMLLFLEELGAPIPEGLEEQEAAAPPARLDDPASLQELLAGLPDGWQADPDGAAHLFSQVFTLSTLPFLLSSVLALDTEGDGLLLLDALVDTLQEARFEADLKPYPQEIQAAYRHLAECAGPQAQQTIRGIGAILQAYAQGRYDMAAAPNELILQARQTVDQDEERALHLVSEAGAVALRGGDYWRRWREEAQPPLANWLAGLGDTIRFLRTIGYYPLAECEEEKVRWEEAPSPPEEGFPPEVQALVDGLFEIPDGTPRPDPQTLDRFEKLRDQAIPALIDLVEDRSTWGEDEQGRGGWAPIVAIHLLGYLQAKEAADLLVEVVAETVWEDILRDAAPRALVAIGRPAYPAVAAYFRYGQDVETKVALAEVLARVGKQEPATFPWLADLWEEATWPQQRRFIAIAFGDLRNRQAVPLLQEALDDPESDFVDQIYVRWALQRMGEPVDPVPTKRSFYEPLSRQPRIHTPLLWPLRLEVDEETGRFRQARYTLWGEPICAHCGQPMEWAAEKEDWVHPERPKRRAAGPTKKARTRKKRQKRRGRKK